MTSDYGSLLALDSFASEESLRVAAYIRALTLHPSPDRAEVVAEAFLDFVGGERWRLEALDGALKFSSRRTTVESVISKAQQIAEWVRPSIVVSEPEPEPEPEPATTLVKKKGTRKKS